MHYKEYLKKIKSDPQKAVEVGCALLRGLLVKARHMLNPNIRIGSNFRAYTWLHISGPGNLTIGNRVSIYLSFLIQPSIITHTKGATVIIGNGSIIGGTRISCVDSVTIDDEALLGSTTIIDSDIIPTKDVTIDKKWKGNHAQPIKIGTQVWCGTSSFVLGGAALGNECVLGAGAVIQNKEVPERSLLIGNPARKIGVTRQV